MEWAVTVTDLTTWSLEECESQTLVIWTRKVAEYCVQNSMAVLGAWKAFVLGAVWTLEVQLKRS